MREKPAVIETINSMYEKALKIGLLTRTPLFWQDYENTYPALRELEASYPAIRSECLDLVRMREQITDVEALGGKYTVGGIHSIQWKSYLLKMGSFVEENCRRCPTTAKAIAKIPGAYIAFFSILSPRQYITPHFGYYKGFLRYHLGVIIPDNNANNSCWLRINSDPEANANYDLSSIDQGKKYFWRDGEGVIFDDTLLHDASNESDEVRVVLWIDIRRPMPFYLDWLHRTFLWAAFKHPYFKQRREDATVQFSPNSFEGRSALQTPA
jgi:aspartyl/asparaginyl beta-hydroxylase (cupin superfamily)